MKTIIFTGLIIDGFEKSYTVICYDNETPIEIGDFYLFFFGGEPHILQCTGEEERVEINPNDFTEENSPLLSLVPGFWKSCYKIKRTNYNLYTVMEIFLPNMNLIH